MSNKHHNRDKYLNQLIAFKDKPFIKVITGIRRCGKSFLLDIYEEYLISTGIKKDDIIKINFESLAFEHIKDYKDLYKEVKDNINTETRTYILLDEIQVVKEWEKAVNSFLVDFDVDIYITGSNAYLLSSELSTFLSGRYVEIKMLPLSFKEYLEFMGINENDNVNKAFEDYLLYGGLPSVTLLNNEPLTIRPFLSGIYNTVIMKDVVSRNNIRDVALLEAVIKFIADNVGNPISTNKISNYLTSMGRKASADTIDNYITMLEKAYIIYRANRYDLKGKMHLKTQEKFYIVDTGIRNELLDFRAGDYGHILENVVYLELIRRSYRVSVGKIDNLEVDFVADGNDEKIYYQVSATILDEKTKERELRPFANIKDYYSKVILTMDRTHIKDFNGIKNINIIDFLLEKH